MGDKFMYQEVLTARTKTSTNCKLSQPHCLQRRCLSLCKMMLHMFLQRNANVSYFQPVPWTKSNKNVFLHATVAFFNQIKSLTSFIVFQEFFYKQYLNSLKVSQSFAEIFFKNVPWTTAVKGRPIGSWNFTTEHLKSWLDYQD